MNVEEIRQMLLHYLDISHNDLSKAKNLSDIGSAIDHYLPNNIEDDLQLIKIKCIYNIFLNGQKLLFSVQNGDNDNPISTMLALEHLKIALLGSEPQQNANLIFNKFLCNFVQVEICPSIVNPANTPLNHSNIDDLILNFITFYFDFLHEVLINDINQTLDSLLINIADKIKSAIGTDKSLDAIIINAESIPLTIDELCDIAADNVHNYIYQVNAYIDMGIPEECICLGKIFIDPVPAAINARMSPLHTTDNGSIISKDKLLQLKIKLDTLTPSEHRQQWRTLATEFFASVHHNIINKQVASNSLIHKADAEHYFAMYGGPITKSQNMDMTICMCATTDETKNIFGAAYNVVISPETAKDFLDFTPHQLKLVLYTQLMKGHPAFVISEGDFAKKVYAQTDHQGLMKAIARQQAYEAHKGPVTSFNIAMNLLIIICQYSEIAARLIKPAYVNPVNGRVEFKVTKDNANCLSPVEDIWQQLNTHLPNEIKFIEPNGRENPGFALELLVLHYDALMRALLAWNNEIKNTAHNLTSYKRPRIQNQ